MSGQIVMVKMMCCGLGDCAIRISSYLNGDQEWRCLDYYMYVDSTTTIWCHKVSSTLDHGG